MLIPTWTALYNAPLVPLSNYNNTVVLGSLVGWVMLVVPIFLVARWGVATYRVTIYERVARLRLVKALKASKVYTVYRWFQVE